jgi:hypothetical protein
MYVAINVEPYDTMQIVLLYNKTVYQNLGTERCLTALRCAAARLAAVAVFTDCQQDFRYCVMLLLRGFYKCKAI